MRCITGVRNLAHHEVSQPLEFCLVASRRPHRAASHPLHSLWRLALLFVIVCFSYRVQWARAGPAFFQGRPVSSVVDLVGEGRRENKNRVNNQTDEYPGHHHIVCVVAGVVLLSDLTTHDATYLRAENHRHLLSG